MSAPTFLSLPTTYPPIKIAFPSDIAPEEVPPLLHGSPFTFFPSFSRVIEEKAHPLPFDSSLLFGFPFYLCRASEQRFYRQPYKSLSDKLFWPALFSVFAIVVGFDLSPFPSPLKSFPPTMDASYRLFRNGSSLMFGRDILPPSFARARPFRVSLFF